MDNVELLIGKLESDYEILSDGRNDFKYMKLTLTLGNDSYVVRPIETAKEVLTYSEGLSAASKDFFCPYPWDDAEKTEEGLNKLIQNHASGRDLAYLLFHEGNPIAFFFLWNLHKNEKDLRIPEIGGGAVDAYHNRGLGNFGIDILTGIGSILEVNATELTTHLKNNIVKNICMSKGYELLGTIMNPLEMDQTESIETLQQASKFRAEYHMAKIFSKGAEVLDYLKKKRDLQNEMFKQ